MLQSVLEAMVVELSLSCGFCDYFTSRAQRSPVDGGVLCLHRCKTVQKVLSCYFARQPLPESMRFYLIIRIVCCHMQFKRDYLMSVDDLYT